MIHNRKKEFELMEELKNCCQFYSVYLEEWIGDQKGHEYLTDQELYAITVFKNNHFKIKMSEGMMFYNKAKLIEGIIRKLQGSKKEFKDWMIDRWQFSLIRSGLEIDLNLYVKLTIEQLNLPNKAKHSLKRFGKSTLTEIFDTYSDADFASDDYFEMIRDFMSSFKTSLNLTTTELEVLEKARPE